MVDVPTRREREGASSNVSVSLPSSSSTSDRRWSVTSSSGEFNSTSGSVTSPVVIWASELLKSMSKPVLTVEGYLSIELVVSIVLRASLTGSTIAMIPRSLQETHRQNQHRSQHGLVVSTHRQNSMSVPMGTYPLLFIFPLF